MSHFSKVISKVPVPVQNRSGFDLSFEHFLTAKVGTLVPAAYWEVLPNDKFRLGCLANVQLPPMATNFFGRVDARLEAFFVPNRLLYRGWQNFITGINSNNDEGATPVNESLPYIDLCKAYLSDSGSYADAQECLGAGTLTDYLGTKLDFRSFDPHNDDFKVSALPYLAYHRIWDDWYRDSRIQKPAFVEYSQDSGRSGYAFSAASLPDYSCPTNVEPAITGDSETSDTNQFLFDRTSILSLRQRNYAKDYFTVASLKPQSGDESKVKFIVDEDGKGEFSIAALRAANSLQKFLERNNIAGSRYIDQIKVHFGTRPADSTLQRPLYLGGTSIGVYNKSVSQTTPYDENTETNNPFNALGAKAGQSQAIGDDMLFNEFHATEHGFIMVMFSLVPHANYSTGQDKALTRFKMGDFAFPVLAGIGDQPIMARELDSNDLPTQIFGYTQRYAEYKYFKDRVSGLLNTTLSPYVLKRGFRNVGSSWISSEFLEIPTTALDEVSAVDALVSDFGCWVDLYFNLKAVRPLPVYSLPTLGDEKDVHTELIDNGGFRL